MLLGLDLGTTNVKALVTDFSGRALGEGSWPVHLFQLGKGGVEQDIEEIWRATLASIRGALKTVNAAEVRAIGVSSQGGAMQMLGVRPSPGAARSASNQASADTTAPGGSSVAAPGDGRTPHAESAHRAPQAQIVGRVISWLDQRGGPFNDELGAELGEHWFAKRLGHGRPGLAIGQLLRLRQQSPALLKAPNRVGFVGDVIVSRLCGRPAHDGTSCSLTLLYNPARRDYDADVLARLGVTAEQLPALLSAREAAGGLLPSVAEQTGLAPGIPVSAAVHDQYTAALSVGAVRAGTVMIGTGTAWVLLAVGDRLTPPATPDAFVCHHAAERLWGQILSLGNGGSALSWALGLTGHKGASADKIDRLLESVPPGSDGVICSPHFAALNVAGLPAGIRARISGLQLSHGPAHIVRAVLEGLAFELRRHIGLLRGAGVPVTRLALSGRAAASRVTPQLLAAATGLPLDCAGSKASSQLGAAIIARGLCEPAIPLAKLAEEMAPAASHVAPAAEVAQMYQARFEEYLRLLPSPERRPPAQRGSTRSNGAGRRPALHTLGAKRPHRK